MGSDSSIDITLNNIWRCWYTWRQGKKRTAAIDNFSYSLERYLFDLWSSLKAGTYRHSKYQKFIIADTKKRLISVASIRDRIVHRLLYDYLTLIFDRTFIYDAWSCRIDKGLHACIERTHSLIKKFRRGWVWRADIAKFFDNVDHDVLKSCVFRRVYDPKARSLIEETISSFSTAPGKGIPIGNLTSQVFANIYLNELDRFVSHIIRPLAMVRYGDDFLVIGQNRDQVSMWRDLIRDFLEQSLKVAVHKKNDIIVPAHAGVHFVGLKITPLEKRLKKRMVGRIKSRLTFANISSYRFLSSAYESDSMLQ